MNEGATEAVQYSGNSAGLTSTTSPSGISINFPPLEIRARISRGWSLQTADYDVEPGRQFIAVILLTEKRRHDVVGVNVRVVKEAFLV